MPQPRYLDNKEARKEAITRLGGVVKVAKWCGVGRNAVSNWYDRGFPRAAYAVLAPKLRRLGYAFSDQAFLQHREKNGGKR